MSAVPAPEGMVTVTTSPGLATVVGLSICANSRETPAMAPAMTTTATTATMRMMRLSTFLRGPQKPPSPLCTILRVSPATLVPCGPRTLAAGCPLPPRGRGRTAHRESPWLDGRATRLAPPWVKTPPVLDRDEAELFCRFFSAIRATFTIMHIKPCLQEQGGSNHIHPATHALLAVTFLS